MSNQESPLGWEYALIKDIAELHRGVSYKKTVASKTEKKGYLPVLRANNINNEINFNDIIYVPEENIKSEQLIRKGDIIIAMSSGSKHLVGKAAQAKNDINSGFGAFCGLIRPADVIDKKYVGYFFHSPSYQQNVRKFSSGININNLRRTHIEELIIPIPPLLEQHRIVAKIEELFTRLDAGVDALKQVRAQLKSYRQSVLKAAVEGRLTAEWREQNKDKMEPADRLLERILKERREKWEDEQLANYEAMGKTPPKNWRDKYKETTPPNAKDLPDLPEGWIWITMDNLSVKITDGEHIRPKMADKGVPFLSAKNVQDSGVIFDGKLYVSQDDAARFRQRCNPERNDILIVSRGATVSRTCVINTDKEFCLLGSVILIKPSRLLSVKYIAYMLKSSTIQKAMIGLSGSTAQQAIYIRDIRNLLIPIAPIVEQEIMTDKVERIFSNIKKADLIIRTELKRAHSLRQTILKHTFEGKLVPQDRNDEPASVLLKRIRAEKANVKKSRQLEIF